ncbi:MAG: glycosyltransferase [Chloroflexi bacterium]|nr:glycosyltransferase [Chloroflexota bacterium]MCL5274939.1 glycosyltransferase [Chloroflexota bacterium]
MNILYIVPYTPTPIRVRPYQLIRSLAQLGHQVTLATVWESPKERQTLDQLRQEGVEIIAAPLAKTRRIWNCLRAIPTTLPLQAIFCDSPRLRHLIDQVLLSPTHSFDIIQVEHLRGVRYGAWLKELMPARQIHKRTPIVWDSVDCITYLFEQAAQYSGSLSRRLIMRLELGRTRHYEGRMVNHFDRVLVTSEADKKALQELAGTTAPISVLSNGVDLEHFCPSESLRQPDTVVFSGKMSYHANVTAAIYLATRVMPLVWDEKPGIRLVIAGSQPAPAIQQLAKSDPGRIVATGYLSDMKLPLQEASVSAAPLLYGAGIQNKVLEAMACATPVVATSRAVAALGVQSGKDCIVADKPEAFAHALLHLLSDGVMRRRIGAAGRCYVEKHHDWRQIATHLETIYTSVIHESPST